MEPFYYSKMNKMQQAAYHAISQGILQMEKEIQPKMDAQFREKNCIMYSSGCA